MSDNPIGNIGIDPNSPLGLFDGIAFRHQMMLRDKAFCDRARYIAYALRCHDQAINVAAGRVDPNAASYVPGQSGWPRIPFECGVDKNAAGFEFVESNQDGPRTLEQVDGAFYPIIPAPEDHHLSDIQRRAGLPQGVFDLGPPENESTVNFAVGQNDTMPAGILFTGPDGHRYMKFSFAGLGYKYQRIS